MEKKKNICSICGQEYYGYGNNAQPINNGRCCNECNRTKVVPFRIAMMCGIVKNNNFNR